MPTHSSPTPDLPIHLFAGPADWADWLEAHHGTAPGVLLQLAKKGAPFTSVTYLEAVEVALCYGWIDGQSKRLDEHTYLQRFTPRRAKSIWSKVNRAKAEALIAAGRMRPAGLAEVERAQLDGRWAAAYDSPATATVPDDLQAALDQCPAAGAFFATLSGTNRYAVLFRVQTARSPATRQKRIADLVAMLERGETLYP
jgi:uncharacterized protein YdeI (YjbR/CyaY-like superfamily)